MMLTTIAKLFENEKCYHIETRIGTHVKVYVMHPRKNPYVEIPLEWSTPIDTEDYYVDIIIVYPNGNFTAVKDKLVKNCKITVTKHKKVIQLPSWTNVSKLKSIKKLREHKTTSLKE